METFQPGSEGWLFDDRVFAGFFALVGVLMVAMFALFLWLLVRNSRVLRSGGGRQRPGTSLAQRLQELDDLHRRGVITDAEHSRARSQALASP